MELKYVYLYKTPPTWINYSQAAIKKQRRGKGYGKGYYAKLKNNTKGK